MNGSAADTSKDAPQDPQALKSGFVDAPGMTLSLVAGFPDRANFPSTPRATRNAHGSGERRLRWSLARAPRVSIMARMKLHRLVIPMWFAAAAGMAAEPTPELPKDAQALRKSFLEAKARALQPIEARYRSELERLLSNYTRAGKLDEALAIRTELGRMGGGALPDQVLGVWQYSDASPANASDIEFHASGVSIYRRNGEKGTWAVSGKTLTITWSGGEVYTVKLPSSISPETIVKGERKGGTEFTMKKL